ncbi:MAG: DUF4363 family protein [Peptococcaceae bacterium]|nr:DUF4363 family protein [Peptococcaceae bacterium]
MRTNFIILAVLIFTIGVAWIGTHAIDSFCVTQLETLRETQNAIMANDWENAQFKSDSIKNSVMSSRSWITILINQRMLNEIEILAERMHVSIQMQDQLSSLSELVSLKSYLEEVRSDTFITITNLL